MDVDGGQPEPPASSSEDGEVLIVDESINEFGPQDQQMDQGVHEDASMADAEAYNYATIHSPPEDEYYLPPPGDEQMTEEERRNRTLAFFNRLMEGNRLTLIKQLFVSSEFFRNTLLDHSIETNAAINAEKFAALQVKFCLIIVSS
jgi:hypothetical protein